MRASSGSRSVLLPCNRSWRHVASHMPPCRMRGAVRGCICCMRVRTIANAPQWHLAGERATATQQHSYSVLRPRSAPVRPAVPDGATLRLRWLLPRAIVPRRPLTRQSPAARSPIGCGIQHSKVGSSPCVGAGHSAGTRTSHVIDQGRQGAPHAANKSRWRPLAEGCAVLRQWVRDNRCACMNATQHECRRERVRGQQRVLGSRHSLAHNDGIKLDFQRR